MIYYYYGQQPNSGGALRANEMPEESLPYQKYGELVIEEDTIYEIDETCLKCKKKKEQEK